jgi:hypothetical protein
LVFVLFIFTASIHEYLPVTTDIPLNLDDTDLGPDIAVVGKPASVLTTTSLQIFAIDIASLQRRMTDYFANKSMTYDKVLELDR